MLKEGDRAPVIRLEDQDGNETVLFEDNGPLTVVYFYPKDNTVGCTRQAREYQQALEAFRAAGVRVVGISKDSTASHSKFADKYGLEFTLLSDPELVAMKQWGVWQEKKTYGKGVMGAVRSSFVVSPEGVILRAKRKVNAAEDAAQVLKFLGI